MKRTFLIAALALSLSGIAAAHAHGSRFGIQGDHDSDDWSHLGDRHRGGGMVAPEIGADSAAAALTLLAGGLVVLRGRRPTRR